jgi:hypothetical protein
MSLLHQEIEDELDDAARGEELTKGSSHIVVARLSAVALVTLIVILYMMHGEKPPVATGEVVQVWTHSRHGETSGLDANGEPMAKENFDQVLVFAHVKLHNQSKVPLLLENILANIKQQDGILSVSAGSAAQYEEAFVAYPELAALHSKVLAPHVFIAPGQSLEGTAFWVVQETKQEWDARKNLDFTFRFQYQDSLVLAPRGLVIEQ